MTEGMPMPEPVVKEGFIARMQQKLKERYTMPAAMDKALRQIESVQGPLTEDQKMQVADQIGSQVRNRVVGAIVRDSIATALVATGVGAYRFNDRIRVNVNVKMGKAAERFGKSVDRGLKGMKKGLKGKDNWFANHLRSVVDAAHKKVVDKKGVVRFGSWFHKDTAAVLTKQVVGREKAARNLINARTAFDKSKRPGNIKSAPENVAAHQVYDAAKEAYKQRQEAAKSLARKAKEIGLNAKKSCFH